MIPNAKPTIGLRMVFPTTHYTAELAIASVGYSAPAMPKTIPAPLLAGAMVGVAARATLLGGEDDVFIIRQENYFVRRYLFHCL